MLKYAENMIEQSKKADAIVNTANPNPIVGRGTDSAIYSAAGKDELLAVRKNISDIAPGDAASNHQKYQGKSKPLRHRRVEDQSADPSITFIRQLPR